MSRRLAPLPLDGRCLCARVRYRVRAQPLPVYACHCHDCQKRCGSAFAMSMLLRRDALELLAGEPARYRVELVDGRIKQGRFCGDCGSRLWGEPARAPDFIVLQPGSLDDTSWLEPVAQIWTKRAQAWIAWPRGVHSCEANPPGLGELVRLWQESAC